MPAGEAWSDAVLAGLTSLGWSSREAEGAVQAVGEVAEQQIAADGQPNVAALLKAALRTLDRSPERSGDSSS